MQHSFMMPQLGPLPDDQACQAKAPPIGFGLWLDRPGHQDKALGHHAGVLHDASGYLFDIMQDIQKSAVISPEYL